MLKGLNLHVLLAAFSVALGMFQHGFANGSTNNLHNEIKATICNDFFRETYNIPLEKGMVSFVFSIVVSMVLVGGIIGAIMGAKLEAKFGPKTSLRYVQVFTISGSLLIFSSKYASRLEMLLIGRLLVGIGVGNMMVLCPIYISSIAPRGNRGTMGTLNQLFISLGAFTSLALGLSDGLGNKDHWPFVFLIGTVPSLIQIIILPFIPESPQYLISKHNMDLALDSLRWLRNTTDVHEEIIGIVSEDMGETKSSWDLIKNVNLRLPLFICICLHLARQFCGMTALQYYSSFIFAEAGLGGAGEYGTLGLSAVLIFMTISTVPCMYKFGRRKIELFGLTGIVISLCLITLALHLNEKIHKTLHLSARTEFSTSCVFHEKNNGQNVNGAGVFLVASAAAFVSFYCVGVASIPWTVTSELFFQEYRSAAASICICINRVANLIQTMGFPLLEQLLEESCFIPYLIATLALLILIYIYFIEPKNRSAKEIAKFLSVPEAWSWKDPVGFKLVPKRKCIEIKCGY